MPGPSPSGRSAIVRMSENGETSSRCAACFFFAHHDDGIGKTAGRRPSTKDHAGELDTVSPTEAERRALAATPAGQLKRQSVIGADPNTKAGGALHPLKEES